VRCSATSAIVVGICATDGCFGYVPSPMHFEHLVLNHLRAARDVESWSAGLQTEISAVTGDDAAMAALAVGADFAELKALFAPRVEALEADFLQPLDAAVRAVADAEAALEAARRREAEVSAEAWQRYKPGYEGFLHQVDAPEEVEAGEPVPVPPSSEAEPSATEEGAP
jgi:soluble cytochrome b562